jgi:hypothetical protein
MVTWACSTISIVQWWLCNNSNTWLQSLTMSNHLQCYQCETKQSECMTNLAFNHVQDLLCWSAAAGQSQCTNHKLAYMCLGWLKNLVFFFFQFCEIKSLANFSS